MKALAVFCALIAAAPVLAEDAELVRANDNAVTHTIAATMTEAEFRAVAEYLSGLD
jgi:hypothetical protein